MYSVLQMKRYRTNQSQNVLGLCFARSHAEETTTINQSRPATAVPFFLTALRPGYNIISIPTLRYITHSQPELKA